MKKDPEQRPITALQMQILRVLWQRGECSVQEVQEYLSPSRALAPTTVGTLLKRLTDRGLVAHRKQGRQFVYRATTSESEILAQTVGQVQEEVFEGDIAAFAAQLLRQDSVGRADLERIRKLIEARERELEG
ncbi:MAG: BlaI/MecI/CopY family transcriptional regulator [Planctomycetota bacterium]